ncbi:MmpS family transport accessory protein [Micromonospora sp. I033]
MSETTSTPEPGHSGGPSDPTAPEPATWTPPDPLAAPQPWAPPAPWTPAAWAPAPWPPPGSAAPGATGASQPPTPGMDPTAAPGPAGWPDPGAGPGPAGWTGPGATVPPSGPNALGGTPYPAAPPVGPAGVPGTAPAPPWPGSSPGSGWPPAGYPPPYAYPSTAPRRSPGGWVVAVVVTVVIALVLAFCGCVGLGVLGSFVDDSTTSGQPYDPEFDEPGGGLAGEPTDGVRPVPATTPSGGRGRFTVVYEVTGTDAVDVQFYDANADFLQFDGVPPPWRLAFTANDRERVQIIASPTDSGEASCRITIDGKVVSQDSGEYGATCFGW